MVGTLRTDFERPETVAIPNGYVGVCAVIGRDVARMPTHSAATAIAPIVFGFAAVR